MGDGERGLGPYMGLKPARYRDPAALQRRIDAYFDSDLPYREEKVGDKTVKVKKVTISGLCRYLGFASRQSFYDYESKPEFTHVIQTARLRIKEAYEERLWDKACVGAIFALKNLGWSDQLDVNARVASLNFVMREKNNEEG